MMMQQNLKATVISYNTCIELKCI